LERCSRWPAGTAAARVHRCSKTAARPLFARSSRAPSRPRALVRLLQVNVATSTTEDRSNIPTTGSMVGTTVRLDRGFPLEARTTAEVAQGQGPRIPNLGAPHRDCSRWRLCPDPDRFGHLVSRAAASSLSGATWGEDGAATAAHDCRSRAKREGPEAPELREEIRRSGARGAFHRRAIRAGRMGHVARRRTAVAACGQRLFHQPGKRARDARTDSGGPADTAREDSKLPCCRLTAAPPATSAFE